MQGGDSLETKPQPQLDTPVGHARARKPSRLLRERRPTGSPPQASRASSSRHCSVRTWSRPAVGYIRVLGPLAADTEQDARLRDTLRLFLAAGSSFKGASDLMNLHANSVKYRVQRAIERRGEPIDDDRLDVEIALLMCQWYGSTMLKRAQ